MQENRVAVSFVTPAYNRSKLLSRCYESLRRQQDKDFEWIIVDDGSTDDTESVVRGFDDTFPITYIKQENGGKHRALNASHPYVSGKYVGILDSDDRLTEDAVGAIKKGWEGFADNPTVGMVTFLKGSTVDDPSCMARPEDEGKIVDIMRYKRIAIHSVDAFEIIRRELFLRYPFPEYTGEKFISEGALWNRISRTHKCVYINKVIYLADYLEGGLTKSGKSLRIRNPYGGMFTAGLNMDRKNYFGRRVKNAVLYDCYGFFAGKTPRRMIAESRYRGLTVLCIPPGLALYLMWNKKYGEEG